MVTICSGAQSGLSVESVGAPPARAGAEARKTSASTTTKSAVEPKSAENSARGPEFGPPAFPVTTPSDEFVAMIAIYWLWYTFCSRSYDRDRYLMGRWGNPRLG